MANKRPLSRPTLLTISINIEGLSNEKQILLDDLCNNTACDILLVQETHRGEQSRRPKINGMKLVLERPHNQYGSAVFVKPDIQVLSASMTHTNDIEILTIGLPQATITSVYKPPGSAFTFQEPTNYNDKPNRIVMGDFNCHSINWGYENTDVNGEKLEEWAEQQHLSLIHDPKQPASFQSGRWRKGYNPDNIFVSQNISALCRKEIKSPLPKTQHRPIACIVEALVKPREVPFKRRFNFKKANWEMFRSEIDKHIKSINPSPKNYDTFVEIVKKASRKAIPRGCRTNYIPGLQSQSVSLLEHYEELYDQDPFSDETIAAGEQLMNSISEGRRERWVKMLEDLDMHGNSRKAWSMVKNLSGDPTSAPLNYSPITANQVATQLLLNAKPSTRNKNIKLVRNLEPENDCLHDPFSIEELKNVILNMKANKAAGLDDIRPEQIKNVGPRALSWILQMYNICVKEMKIPKIWRRARVVALLKPGKTPDDAKNFRPISLLCQTFKLMERLILNRIHNDIDNNLIREQAGFRPGKSCCGQILNIVQHIEDGFEEKKITGAALIDLSAAYDTVPHNNLVHKLFAMTKDFRLTSIIRIFLQNRSFYVSLLGKSSRWRKQKNGLPQGSVLAPMLYNIYTNDQPIHPETKHFVYADDTMVAAQGNTFEEVEQKLEKALEDLAKYYKENSLRPNPTKTQVSAFHLRNREARRKLNISWCGQMLEHCYAPKYLGVTLDRSLTYRQHCINTKKKVSTRNNIIAKLSSRQWGAQPSVLRTTALGLSFSAAEYASPVWSASAHTKQVDVALNNAVRMVTGCLKPTPIQHIYSLAGIAPPHVRRRVAAEEERKRQETDPRHPLYGHQPATQRLRSRHSFLHRTPAAKDPPGANRVRKWRSEIENPICPIKEEPAAGFSLPFPVWRTLNRLRTGVSACRASLRQWGKLTEGETDTCTCGQIQDPQHLLNCPDMGHPCTMQDLILANDRAIFAANHWRNDV